MTSNLEDAPPENMMAMDPVAVAALILGDGRKGMYHAKVLALCQEPRTVHDLWWWHGIPPAAAYRTVHNLLALGLLRRMPGRRTRSGREELTVMANPVRVRIEMKGDLTAHVSLRGMDLKGRVPSYDEYRGGT
jgi:hypothetical protein